MREEDEGLYKITKKQKHAVKMTQQLTDGELKEGQADDMFAKAVKSLLTLSSDTNQDFVLCEDESPAAPATPYNGSTKASIMLTKSGKLLGDEPTSQPVAAAGVAKAATGQDGGGRKAEDEDEDEKCMQSGLLTAFGGAMNMNRMESAPKAAKARAKATTKAPAARKRKAQEAVEAGQHPQVSVSVQDLQDGHGPSGATMPPPSSVPKKGRVTQAVLVENDERFADEVRALLHQLLSQDVNPMPDTNEADLVVFARGCNTRLCDCLSKKVLHRYQDALIKMLFHSLYFWF